MTAKAKNRETPLESAVEDLALALSAIHQHNLDLAHDGRRDPDTTNIEETWLRQLSELSKKMRATTITGRSDEYVPDLYDE